MMQVPISQGRVVPDNDAERVAVGLDGFTRQVAPDVLAALTEFFRRQKSGHVRMFLVLTRGEITSASVVAEQAVDLDGARR